MHVIQPVENSNYLGVTMIEIGVHILTINYKSQ
jgi:hypothetical protein